MTGPLVLFVFSPLVLGFLPYTTFNSILIFSNVLTNRNIALIYSVTISEQKTKDCELSGSFQHKLQHLWGTFVFDFDVCRVS